MTETNKEPTPEAATPEVEDAKTHESADPMQKMQDELQEYKDKYLRLLAETENMRKRMFKEKQEMTRFSIDNALAEILPPLDNLEKALEHADKMSPEVKNWAMGFQMILTQFKEVLQNHGITSFSSVDTHFDPFLHEAVEVEETNSKPEGTVLEEYVRGYKTKDRTIRPARVKVAKKPQDSLKDSLIKE